MEEIYIIPEHYMKGFKTYVYEEKGDLYRTKSKEKALEVDVKITPSDKIFYSAEEYWDEVEYRSMCCYMGAFGDLRMYAFEYSSLERMEIYAPELFI